MRSQRLAHRLLERRRKRRRQYPVADLRAGRGERRDVLDVERGELRCGSARRARPAAEIRDTPAAVVANPPGTVTPSLVRRAIISPSEAFLPPTVSTSRIPRRSKGMAYTQTASQQWMSTRRTVSRRTVFIVSDQTGVTAETMGHSLLTQFDGLEFRPVTLPFVSTLDKAEEVVRKINRAAEEEGVRPIVFSTLVQDDLRDVVMQSKACSWISLRPSSARWSASSRRAPRTAPAARTAWRIWRRTRTRINATNFALANDDGDGGDYAHARCDPGRRVPLGQDADLPVHGAAVRHFRRQLSAHGGRSRGQRVCRHASSRIVAKLYALTIKPERLQQIRSERRPESRYASRQQVQYELRAAEALFSRYSIPLLDTTECSIEEIASRILNNTGIERRLRP